MFLLLKYIAKLLKALASEASPVQLAGGFVLGMIIGLTPVFSLHNAFILILLIILKVNIGMALLAFILFSGVRCLSGVVEVRHLPEELCPVASRQGPVGLHIGRIKKPD